MNGSDDRQIGSANELLLHGPDIDLGVRPMLVRRFHPSCVIHGIEPGLAYNQKFDPDERSLSGFAVVGVPA